MKDKISVSVSVDVSIEEIIDKINNLPLLHGWNLFANMISRFDLKYSGLTDEQRKKIIEFLEQKLKELK